MTRILVTCLLVSLPALAERPNVVVILADDLGYRDLGVQGGDDIPTPHIDSLARDGVRCTSAYVTCPVCAPTRAGLLTGRYQQRFGFEHNPGPERTAARDFGLPREERTLAERLRAAGYATGIVGKWHLGYRDGLQPSQRGFDSFFGFLGGARSYLPDPRRRSPLLRGTEPVPEEEGYLTDAFGREAVTFVERHAKEPFFLYLSFNAVHSPLQAGAQHLERFAALEGKRRTYAAMVAAMDDAVGRVLERLRDHGLEQRTLVFFLGDNGGPTRQTTARNDPLRGFKGQVYEGGIRVPFLVRWTGRLDGGRVYDRPVSALDIVATALAAAGVQPDPGLDGTNLLPFLRGERTEAPHEALFWRFGPQSAVRKGDWKLIGREGNKELYNLRDDPGEARDLAALHPEAVEELQETYEAWDRQMVPARWRRGERSRTTGPEVERTFRAFDVDGDGRLSAEELGDRRLLRRLDTDGDGYVSRGEAEARYGGDGGDR